MDSRIVDLVSRIIEFGDEYVCRVDKWEVIEEAILFYKKIESGDIEYMLCTMRDNLEGLYDDGVRNWCELYIEIMNFKTEEVL